MVTYASDSAVRFSAATGEMGLKNGLVKFDEYYIGPYDMLGRTKELKPEYIDSLRTLQVR